MTVPGSPNNTIVTDHNATIIDKAGNVWGITALGQISVNGKVDTTTAHVLTLAYENGGVWQMNTQRLWWSKSSPSAAWAPVNGTTASPLVGVASNNNTVIMGMPIVSGSIPQGSITDANGDRYAITSGGQVSINGIPDQTTSQVIAIAYENGVLWQENVNQMWWSKTSAVSPWGPTYGTPSSPIPAFQPIPQITYFDGAIISYTNTITPRAYSVQTVADGDKGVAFTYNGVDTNNGTIRNSMGILNLRINGSTSNMGTIIGQGGIGGTTTNINMGQGSAFQNGVGGRIDINASAYVHNTLTVTMLDGGDTFSNQGVIEANGAGQYISLWSAPGQNPYPTSPFFGQVINNGLIQVSGGANLYLTTPVTGTGTLKADNGSWLVVNGPIGAGETISLNSAHLEFGPKGGITNPAMQFQGKIVGENAASTINLDGVYGTSDFFRPISTAGAGLGELQVFDAYHILVADMLMVGHFQTADFAVIPNLGPAHNPRASDTYTNVVFTDHPNTPGIAHS
jgi:hypothetical protein